jgi:hypothetical protein
MIIGFVVGSEGILKMMLDYNIEKVSSSALKEYFLPGKINIDPALAFTAWPHPGVGIQY